MDNRLSNSYIGDMSPVKLNPNPNGTAINSSDFIPNQSTCTPNYAFCTYRLPCGICMRTNSVCPFAQNNNWEITCKA